MPIQDYGQRSARLNLTDALLTATVNSNDSGSLQ